MFQSKTEDVNLASMFVVIYIFNECCLLDNYDKMKTKKRLGLKESAF